MMFIPVVPSRLLSLTSPTALLATLRLHSGENLGRAEGLK
jgi:hypothetical protein